MKFSDPMSTVFRLSRSVIPSRACIASLAQRCVMQQATEDGLT
jgi:hypothetical protein